MMAAQQTGNSLENCVPASELSGLSLESRSCLELLVAHAASPVQEYVSIFSYSAVGPSLI